MDDDSDEEAPTDELALTRLTLEVHPSPFNPQTAIAYELPERTIAAMRVYDLSGRLVDVLLDGEAKPAGRHTVTWTGRDLQGHAAPSGVYIVRLETDERMETRKITLFR